MFNLVLEILLLIVFAYCAFSVLYFLIFSVAGFLSKKSKNSNYSLPVQRIAILVPAYKEDGIILSTAQNLLKLDYPQNWYDIYVIADSFQQSTIEQLKKLRVNVIEVAFENSTKTKSLNQALK